MCQMFLNLCSIGPALHTFTALYGHWHRRARLNKMIALHFNK